MARLGGARRSGGNPNVCNRCNGHIADGQIVELAVFFADLSGYTDLTRELGPQRTHEILDAFLRRATAILVAHDGYVSQFVGDEVMAFFNVPVEREDYAARAVDAALALGRALDELAAGFGRPLALTVGIAVGHARVGRVGEERIAHFSAIGDVVNRAARLVAAVAPGGILVDAALADALPGRLPGAERRSMPLKGFAEPAEVVLIRGRAAAPPVAGDRRAPAAMLATTLAAVLSAPCAGYLALNALALGLGFGSLGVGALGTLLDQSWLRMPLLTLAALGAGLILFTVFARRPRGADIAARPTRLERRRTRAAIAVAVAALVLVAAELVAHRIMH